MKCVNCGDDKAVRFGDTFQCTACGYKWDVEHEQRMAHYLRAIGREPARPAPVTPKPKSKPRRARTKRKADKGGGID